MVSIVSTQTKVDGDPSHFIPQIGCVVSNQYEVVCLDGSLKHTMPYKGQRGVSPWQLIDPVMPSRAVILSRNPDPNLDLWGFIYYDLEAQQEIDTSIGRPDGERFNWLYLAYPFAFVTPWGEKFFAWIQPGNPGAGRLGFMYVITHRWFSYPRIEIGMGLQQPPGFEESDAGPKAWGSAGVLDDYAYIIYCAYDYLRLVRYPLYMLTYYYSTPVWLLEKVREMTNKTFNWGNTPLDIMFFEKGTIYTIETYKKPDGTWWYRVWRSYDGATRDIDQIPTYAHWPYVRRIAQNKVLIAIYRTSTAYGSPTHLYGLYVLDLSSFTVSKIQSEIANVTGGNAYMFRDSNGYINLIQIAKQYVVKLYRVSQTRVKIVTTDITGSPVSLKLTVYKNRGYVNEFGGDRNMAIGSVQTGSDGIGYFDYNDNLALLHFEWADPNEGYAYNYIYLGKTWKAVKLGKPEWYA